MKILIEYITLLTKYSQYSVSHKLREFLGDVEEKVSVAAVSGTEPGVRNKLMTVLPQRMMGNSLLTRRVLPESMILSNMTGRALWQTFANITTDDDNKSAVADKQYTKQMDKDKLLIESSLAVELTDRIEQLEQEYAHQMELVEKTKGKDKGKETKLLKETTRRLNKDKDELLNIKLRQKQTKEALEEAQTKLADLLAKSGSSNKSDD
ncbi:hypothetical protein LSH36_315g03015 [Paralvinella palmiformis]|uniref:Uncharacterized protein n=1 Tax=Paralvinella palmiformis TaxID=53620 RepID=A0AAD9JHK9_9ANNE|nr:hypothetical protein LSH36_315g03015 [Paralvinella palmiformis]